MKKLKKNYDVLFILGNLSIGGVEKINISIANYFATNYKQNIAIVVLTNIDPQLKFFISKKVDLFIFQKSNILKTSILFFNFLKSIKTKIIFSSIDYINVFTFFLVKLSRIKSKLILSERADPEMNIKMADNLKEKIFYFFSFIVGFSYKNCDLVHCISEGIRENLFKTYKIDKKKMVVIYNPFDFTEINKLKIIKKKINKKNIKLLTVGRLVKQKDHQTLIRALNLVKDKINFHLFVVGDGPELTNLKDLVMSFELEKKITFVGKQKNPNKFYKMADIFILSSLWEGFGNVLVEALAYNCRVISSNCPSGPSEILDNGKWGSLFPVRDTIALSNELLKVIDKDLYLNTKKRAKDFSIDKICDQYKKIFNQF